MTSAETWGNRVLVVDDDLEMRDALRRFLVRLDWEVVSAASGEEALRALEAQSFTLALFDVRLPGMSGTDLVQEAIHLDRNLAIVMISGETEAVNATVCMQRGAIDYLVKPVQLDALERVLQRAVRERQRRMQEYDITHYLREELAKRSAEVQLEQANLERLALGALGALVSVQEAGDPYLAGHSVRVAEFAASIAAQLGRSDEEVELVRRAGQLHDLGMIAIPSAVLKKKGRLLPDEFEQVKQHSAIGSDMLAPLPGCEELARFVRHHHERWDGSGYPDGLAGMEIPWGGRLLAAAEAYDALTSARPYQKQYGPDAAIARMKELGGTILDPKVVDALAVVVNRRQTLTFVADLRDHPEPVEFRGPGSVTA